MKVVAALAAVAAVVVSARAHPVAVMADIVLAGAVAAAWGRGRALALLLTLVVLADLGVRIDAAPSARTAVTQRSVR